MAALKDLFTRALSVVAVVWGGRLAWELHKDIRVRQMQYPDSYPLYTDFYRSLWICVGMLVVQYLFKQMFGPVARALIPRKPRWSYAVWGAKIVRCSDAVFKCGYYAAMTTWGFSVLKGKPWVPWVLGGDGDTKQCWTDGFPYQPVPDDLKQFYLTVVGYHLAEVVGHLFEIGYPDFWEMLLHHTLTCFLVCFSYVLNYVRVGSLVMLLHGAADVFIYWSKAVVDTQYTRLIVASYFALVAAYAWFRIYIFPVYVMRSAWIESVAQAGSGLAGWTFLNFALCVLLTLHIYWFGLIIKIGWNFRKTGEARDMQANVSAVDLKEKRP